MYGIRLAAAAVRLAEHAAATRLQTLCGRAAGSSTLYQHDGDIILVQLAVD